MALPDPIPTLTVDSVTYDFARSTFGENSSKFVTADGNDTFTVSRQVSGSRTRFLLRCDRRKIAEDPFSGTNQEYKYSAHIVYDVPKVGVSVGEVTDLSDLLLAIMASGTPDNSVRVVQGEL